MFLLKITGWDTCGNACALLWMLENKQLSHLMCRHGNGEYSWQQWVYAEIGAGEFGLGFFY